VREIKRHFKKETRICLSCPKGDKIRTELTARTKTKKQCVPKLIYCCPEGFSQEEVVSQIADRAN